MAFACLLFWILCTMGKDCMLSCWLVTQVPRSRTDEALLKSCRSRVGFRVWAKGGIWVGRLGCRRVWMFHRYMYGWIDAAGSV